MALEFEKEEQRIPYNVLNTQHMMKWLETDQAPLVVPGQGIVSGVRSAESGKVFRGANQLLAQSYLKEMGKTDNELITYDQAKKAGTYIKRGAKSFPLTVFDSDKMESKTYHYFTKSDLGDPSAVQPPPNANRKNSNEIITIQDTEPVKYIGKYLMACQLGCQVKVDEQTSAGFKSNFLNELKTAAEKNNYTKIFAIGNQASEFCRQELSQRFEKNREQNSERTQTQKPAQREYKQNYNQPMER